MPAQKVAVNGEIYDLDYSTPDELEARLSELKAEGLDVRPVEESKSAALGHGLMQGVSLGFGDELYAGIKAPFSDQSYSEIRDDYRNKLAAIKEANPKTFIAGELAGGIAPSLLPAGAVARGVQAGGKVMPALGRASLLGMGEGAAAGLGYSEADNFADAAVDTATGATLGGVFGGATQLATPLIGSAGRGLRNVMTDSVAGEADNVLARALKSGGNSPSLIAGDMAELGPGATLLDVNPVLRDLGAATKQTSDDALATIEGVLIGRQQGAKERVVGALEDAANIKEVRVRTPGLDNKIEGLSGRVSEAYDAARAVNIPKTPELEQILNTPHAQAHMREVVKNWQSSKLTDANPFDGEAIPLEALDMLKKQLNEGSKALGLPGASTVAKNNASSINDVASMMVDRVDQLTDKYAPARALSQKQIGMRNALNFGRETAKRSPESVQLAEEGMKGLKPREQVAAKAGMLESIINRDLGGRGQRTGDVAGKIYDAPGDNVASRRLRLLASDDDAYDALESKLLAERQFNETQKYLTNRTGSRTAPFESATERAADAGGLLTQAAGAITNPAEAANFLRNLGSRGVSEGASARIAEILTIDNPQQAMREVQRIMERGEISVDIAEEIIEYMSKWHTGALSGSAAAAGTSLLVE